MNEAKRHGPHGWWVITLILFTTLGCGGVAQLESPDDAPETADGRTEGRLSLISVEPVVYTGKGDPAHYELLADTTFEKLMEGVALADPGVPGAWRWLTGDRAAVEWAEAEESAITLPPSAGGLAIQQVTADLGPLDPGAELVATMRAKSDTPNTLGVVLSYESAQQEREAAEGHPGDGEWHDVTLRLPVPQGIRQNQFKCTVVHRKEAAAPADVASVRLTVENQPALAAAQNLVVNGGFESYGFTTPPYPWQLDRWNSIGKPIAGGDAVPVSATGGGEGEIAMSFTPPEDGTNVRISQPVLRVTPSDAGVKLVATVQALAHHEQELWVRLRGVKNNRDAPGQNVFAMHPGDGQWHEVTVEMTAPKPDIADTIHLDIFRRAFTQEEAVVDNARVQRVR